MLREGGSCGVSANEYSCAHGAQINFGDLTTYLTYACHEQKRKPRSPEYPIGTISNFDEITKIFYFCQCYRFRWQIYRQCQQQEWIFIDSQCNVLPVQQQRRTFTTTLMLIFYWYPLATSQSKHFIRNHYMSVRCNPTASQQNMNKLSVSQLFSFIAGAVNTGD